MSGSRKLVLLALVLLTLGFVGTACSPVPGTVDVAGDSVSAQAFAYTTGRPGATAVADREMVHAGWGCHDVEATLREHVNAARPERLIWALGPNDALPAGGGWALSDIACWHDALHSVDPATCVVLVTPGYGAGFPADWAGEHTEALPAGATWHDARRCIAGLRRLPAVVSARIADRPRGGQAFVPAPMVVPTRELAVIR